MTTAGRTILHSPQLIKRSIIFHLCSSIIAWDNYTLLKMISESFPARDRFLNISK